MKCVHCGKGIQKHTKRVQFELTPTKYHAGDRFTRYVYIGGGAWPLTIADCRKHTNQHVVSVARKKIFSHETDKTTDIGIAFFNEWDGETYLPRFGFFCSNNCAGEFAKAEVKRQRRTRAAA